MSFSAVIDASLGRAGTLTSQLAVIVNNLGGLVVFLIIIGDVLAGRADEPGLLAPFGCAFRRRASRRAERSLSRRATGNRGTTGRWRWASSSARCTRRSASSGAALLAARL